MKELNQKLTAFFGDGERLVLDEAEATKRISELKAEISDTLDCVQRFEAAIKSGDVRALYDAIDSLDDEYSGYAIKDKIDRLLTITVDWEQSGSSVLSDLITDKEFLKLHPAKTIDQRIQEVLTV